MRGYRTMAFNTGLAIWGVIETADWGFLEPEYKGPLLIAIGIVGAILRVMTTSPVGKQTPIPKRE